jgi:Domain of unknown function (DUF4391)
MTPEALIAAFALPAGPPPRRVPKASLSDHAPTAADRRLIDKALARLDWVAGLTPATIGVPAGEAEGLTIDTINLLSATTRGAPNGIMPPRLAEIIHRAIPKPVILIHTDESGSTASLSLAPKRAAEREAARVVTTEVHDSAPLTDADAEFVATLALSGLPTRDLAALYAGLIERMEALAAARIAGRAFRLAASVQEAAKWRDAMRECCALNAEIAAMSAAIQKEQQLARRVEAGEAVRLAKIRLDKTKVLLE